MKNRYLLVIFFIVKLQTFFCQINFEWINKIDNAQIWQNQFEIDNSGNIIITGFFSGTVDFDPSINTFELIAPNIQTSFLAKYTKDGIFQWAKKYDINSSDFKIGIDQENSIFLSGSYHDSIDLNPDDNEINLVTNDGQGIFFSKLDSLGNYVWGNSAKGLGNWPTNGKGWTVDIEIDNFGNFIAIGVFENLWDFNPTEGVQYFTTLGNWDQDIFILKLDNNGNFIWVKRIGENNIYTNECTSLFVDSNNNIYLTGYYRDTIDFDPNFGVHILNALDFYDIFLIKLTQNGQLSWAKSFGGVGDHQGSGLIGDNNSIVLIGSYWNSIDFNSGNSNGQSSSLGQSDIFVLKLDTLGTFKWVKNLNGIAEDYPFDVEMDNNGNIFTMGWYSGIDSQRSYYISKMDSSGNLIWLTNSNILNVNGEFAEIKKDYFGNIYITGERYINNSSEVFFGEIKESKIHGRIFNDINSNCEVNQFEWNLGNLHSTISPINEIVCTNGMGFWHLDSLPAGNYTITIDTSNTNWTPTCPITQSFTVVHSDSLTIAPSFGMVSNNPCPSPTVSVNMPFMRPCFTGQQVHVQACNEYDATGVLPDAYSIVALDPNLIFESASLPYTSLGNNQYRFEHDTLYPGQCVNYTISTQVDCNTPLGLTLCLEANLYPVADCVLDTIPTPPSGEVTPCTLPWDQSSLSVEGWCANDSIYFTITNTGELGGGDMECYSPVRIYIDGVPCLLDSIKLLGGETFTYVFEGNGATWILEADQHPLHPGNSHPNAHVENCNPGNWTPDIVNNFPTDDADPVKDIYCGVVTGSYDPNDKKGTPYGLGAEHEVLPNQDIEYLIRFQNTGTDTAFTVVVRDTLDLDFDIFSVTPGSASHNYSFRMYGPRVLEWTFANILLPDSTTNEPLSNGFLSYRVKQKPNLADGTLLTNEADIYFDFNTPIITNETSHKVQRRTFEPTNSLPSLSQTKIGIKLYPNPSKQETTLSFSTYQKQISYKLLNLSGQVVLEKANLYGKEVKVNLSELPNGMYLMELKTTQGNEIVKVVKE